MGNKYKAYSFNIFNTMDEQYKNAFIHISHGPVLGEQIGEQILPWGSLCECTPLGDVVGNLAQAKTGSTQDPFCIEKFCNEFEFVPLWFHRCDSLKKMIIVK